MNTDAAIILRNLVSLAIRMTPVFVCLKQKYAKENIAAVSVYLWVLMVSVQALFHLSVFSFALFQGLFSALFFLILMIFFEGSLMLKIFLYFSAWFFSSLISSQNALFGFLLRSQSALRYEHISLILSVVMYFFYYLLMKYYLKERILRLFDRMSTQHSALIMMLPIVFLFLLYLGEQTIFREEELLSEGMPTILFFFGFCTMMFLLYLVAVADTLRTIDQRTADEKLKAARQIIDLKRENYNQLLEYQQKIRIIRHDFFHHIHALQHMGDDERKTYLENMQEELHRGDELFFCDNPAVNALLQEYANRSRAEQTRFNADLALDEQLPVDNLSLCVILGNLLENALDACKKCQNDRFIHLQVRSEERALRIMVRNRYDGVVRKRDNLLLSTKKNGGLGMISIRRLLDHPKDDFDFYYDGDTFTAMVYLAERGEEKEAGETKRPEETPDRG